MDPSFLAVQALSGLSSASSLFIAACGLTIVFGVTRIVNFAHGSLYMIGAYTAATLVPRLLELSFGPVTFWAGILLSALVVGIIGVVIEVLLLRRIYGAPELFQLLATFGVVLVVQDLVIQVFGPEDILGPRAPGLRAPVEILGRRFPSYELVLIAAGPVVLGLVWLLLRRTRGNQLSRLDVVVLAQRTAHGVRLDQPGVGRVHRLLHLSRVQRADHGSPYLVRHARRGRFASGARRDTALAR